jgi:hypothetical protein
VAFADPIGRLDQPSEFGCRVVRGDPTGTMSEQILSILEADTGCPQSPTERVLEVMHPHVGEISAIASADPRGSEHAPDRTAVVGEHERWINTAAPLDR